MDLNSTSSSTSNISTTALSECLVVQYQDFVPWNNSENIISFETEDLIRRLNCTVILPILFLIGGPANIINMAVFHKQGLKERINVCLFALSLADFLYVAYNMVLYGEQLFNANVSFGPVYQWMANHYLLGFFGVTSVSQVLSAIIASERCFCILRPLHSHTVLRTSTTTAIIIAVYVVVTGAYFVVSSRYYNLCSHDLVGEFYNRHKNLVDILDVFIYGVGLPWVVLVIVTSTTIVTAVKLRQMAYWRMGTSSRGGDGGGEGGGMSTREIALTKMLVYNSVFFVICVFPLSVFKLTLVFVPEMNAGRKYHNFYMASIWLLCTLTYINATFNFLIYYTMGSRYRHTLRSLLCFHWRWSGKTHKGESSKE